MPSRFALAQQQGHDALRRAFLDTASVILIDEGPNVLTRRRVAAAVGSSRSVLDTVFGGEHGFVDGLHWEGCERRRRRMEVAVAAVAGGDDPLALHVALGRA